LEEMKKALCIEKRVETVAVKREEKDVPHLGFAVHHVLSAPLADVDNPEDTERRVLPNTTR
jgi:hypothetical protein